MKINGVGVMLNKKSPKIIEINDIMEWYAKGGLELSPNYQRNSVWNDKAKSYLIDSIIRGFPIPPIFMRQHIDVVTRQTYREIIDGQQRLRAIIEFINNEFKILKSHNDIYGGKFFYELDNDIKEAILEYELFVEIINEKDDSVIYDMFARLNTNNCVLNRQELRNAKYWGEFKVAAYNISGEYRDVLLNNKILSNKKLSRMDDVELFSMLLGLLINGIGTDTPGNIDSLYEKYDSEFAIYPVIKDQLDGIMTVIIALYDYLNGDIRCFSSKVYFYTLFAVVAHQLFGLPNFNGIRNPLFASANMSNEQNVNKLIKKLVQFECDFDNFMSKGSTLNDDLKMSLSNFEKLHRTRTTNKAERLQRVEFLNNYIAGDSIGE